MFVESLRIFKYWKIAEVWCLKKIEVGVVIAEGYLSQPDLEAWDFFKQLFSYSREGLNS